MTDAPRRPGPLPVLFAALLAAMGVFSAGADSLELQATSGLNFETALVDSIPSAPAAGSKLTLVAADAEAGVFTATGLDPDVRKQAFGNLTAARSVVLDGYLVSEDGMTTNAAAHELLVMANVHDDDWIYETAETYTNGLGTGVWSGREYAQVSNGLIQIDTKAKTSATNCVRCSFPPVPAEGALRGYVIDIDVVCSKPLSELPDPAGQVLGLTMGCVDDGLTDLANFYFVQQGGWTRVPAAVCDPLVSTNWQVHIAVDSANRKATYYARPSADESWSILGTAQLGDVTMVSEVEFRGICAVAGLRGNGFDTQLLQVDVEFGSKNLYPGCNFEATIVTGRVNSTIIHPTDRLGGQYMVRLSDLDGNVISNVTYGFTASGTMEFYVKASDLTAGASYRADVYLDSEAEANAVGASEIAVMGRALTNESWGVEGGLWVCENAETFRGELRGTGRWVTNDEQFVYAAAPDDWIHVKTVNEEEGFPLDAKVSFLPTNIIGETTSGYVSSIRVVFTEVAIEAENEEALYGLTVGETDDGPRFLCLSNGVWKTVPHAVAKPVLGVEYGVNVYVEKDLGMLYYFVCDPSGNQIRLMAVDLDPDRCREFSCVDLLGVGRVTDMAACVYSTELIRLHVDFDDDVLYPGTNFEASAANGVIRFEQLWETDRTHGQIRVTVRDKYGVIIGQRRISFHDLTDRPFEYYIEGLVPGETYSVDVSAEVKGVDSDGSFASGSMARVVTNALWATDWWIRENADTFAGRELGTGTWDDGGGLAVETNGCISINTAMGEDESARVSFLATNELPFHTGFEIRTRLTFDMAGLGLPSVEGKYGITLVYADPEAYDENATYRFAVLLGGEWTEVDCDTFAPRPGVEYDVVLRVDYKTREGYYAVRPAGADELPTIIATFELADFECETPYETDYYGIGRVRKQEGDGFDISLVEITAEVDRDLLTPGTNFASTVAAGVLHIRQIWLTDRTSGDFTITVRDAYGNIVAQTTLSYDRLVDLGFNVPIPGLQAGVAYDVEISATLEGDEVLCERTVVPMGRVLGGWICEDAATFAGEEIGTGLWAETNETGVVETEEGRAIKILAPEGMSPVLYDPTNDTLSVRSSMLREIRFHLNFDEVGWYASEAAPEVPSNALAAVTVWCDDAEETLRDEDYALAVLSSNGTWRVLDETRAWCRVGLPCDVSVLIDYKAGYVRYEFASQSYTNRVHQFDFGPQRSAGKTSLSFSGTGSIWSIDGDVWDSNLIRSSTNEYADLNEAIRGTAGTDEILSPLWWAEQIVTVDKGSFRVYDPNHWMNIIFPHWYYVIIEGDEIKIYRFNQSNNWIDYAEGGPSNVVVNGSVFLVKTPEGLSWIAARATNEWISGRIELVNDIDLSAHNWTPIAGFSGTFDGLGRTITGLNNSYHNVGVPGGEYMSGPTNEWGRSAYGLFGTATNATLTGVTFAGVAISNMADSVAALAGALAGDCAVSNVTVESGTVFGFGGTVAGLAGFADFADFLTVINNTNGAAVVAKSDETGDGRWAAGLLCVAGPTNPAVALGTVVVTNNMNLGTVSGPIRDTDLVGGNIAQILVGTTPAARFGDVYLTNNFALGTIEMDLTDRSDWNEMVATNFHAVNLAPAYWGFSSNGTFLTSFDANNADAVPVDPVWRTARMLSRWYVNGAENEVGRINDEITTLTNGSVMVLSSGLECWGSIFLDRNMTFDLGGYLLYTTYVQDTFVIGSGVHATVRNGEIVVGYGETEETEVQAFSGDLTYLTTTNLIVTRVDDIFYERTTLDVNGYILSVLDLNLAEVAEVLNSSGTVIQLYDGADVEIDVAQGTFKVNGCVLARLDDCYSFKVLTDADGAVVGYEVRVADSAAPTSGTPVFDAVSGKVRMTVGNAQPGFWYALQHKETLVGNWETPSASEWTKAETDGVTVEADATGSQGYYRVIMSDTPGGAAE